MECDICKSNPLTDETVRFFEKEKARVEKKNKTRDEKGGEESKVGEMEEASGFSGLTGV